MRKMLMLFFLAALALNAQDKVTKENVADFVNPLIGTESDFKLSNGNTYPAVALPWGMNFWTPYTGPMGDGWQYSYGAKKIRGFKQTHQPSPWINDYGAFSIMPVTGELKYKQDDRASWFSHKRETVKPYYYKVYLGDYDVWVEMAPTERAASFRIAYPGKTPSYLVLDAFFKGSYVKIIPKERKIIGYCRNNSGGVPENFHNYFVLTFDTDFEEVSTWDSAGIAKNNLEKEGTHVGAIIKFKGNEKRNVNIKVASSFISYDQAALNLKSEIGDKSFDQVKESAKNAWSKELIRTHVEGGTHDQNVTFYTALYRLLLFPRKFYEIDANKQVMHYSPYNGQVLPGFLYTDNGFWDTFRAVYPYFTIMYPDIDSEIMNGLANTYKESGWLPEWASPGHRECMIGSNSASLIADAYIKGIRGFDINTLFEAIMKNSKNAGPLSSVGRKGVEYYNNLGYIPYNVNVNENVGRTLEYSYDDFTIMKLAKLMNKPQSIVDTFAKRAFYYKNVFDKSTNFMRGRNLDGNWQSPFRPDKWGDAFTEGCSWHWTWCVFHDPQGLIDLMGGKENFVQKLDSLFIAAPTFDDSYYGAQIHEITEMVIAGMGQFAHGNEPQHHGLYLYDYAGAPWKAQQHVRETMDLLYTPYPDGLCGDEDNGQMSAWYVFSALGFYPVCPGTDQYVIGTPLFAKATLTLENGKKFVIEAKNNSKDNYYIKDAKLNNKAYSKNYITHESILKGGKLQFEMSGIPNKKRGTNKEDLPYSYSTEVGSKTK
jgi:predicted alpha-1,2-mannosidase